MTGFKTSLDLMQFLKISIFFCSIDSQNVSLHRFHTVDLREKLPTIRLNNTSINNIGTNVLYAYVFYITMLICQQNILDRCCMKNRSYSG